MPAEASSEFARAVLARFQGAPPPPSGTPCEQPELETLTARERVVLERIAGGDRPADAARALGLPPAVVEADLAAARRKFELAPR